MCSGGLKNKLGIVVCNRQFILYPVRAVLSDTAQLPSKDRFPGSESECVSQTVSSVAGDAC